MPAPAVFLRYALSLSAAWFLALYPALNWLAWDKLPKSMRIEGSDFGQYYSGALAARHGLWQQLYPIPKAEVYNYPPRFKPRIETEFFKQTSPEQRQGQWCFYPQVANPEGSDLAPELLAHCPRLQTDWHFINPPPVAVYLWPLGFFDHRTASNLWFALMCASFFGIGWLSSRIYRRLAGKITYAEGCIALLPMVPTCLGSNMSTTLQVGNASPFLGFLIALVAYAWMHNKQRTIGVGMILLMPFKGIGLSWCPLLCLKPVKWKSLTALALLTMLVNGVTIYCAGMAAYRTFLFDVLPKSRLPVGTGLQSEFMATFGIDPKPWFLLVDLVLLALLYRGYFRGRKSEAGSQAASTTISTLAGTLAVFCLTNPVVWPHYCTIYLFLPFAGWFVWEGLQSTGRWRVWISLVFVLNFYLYLDHVLLLRDSVFMGWLQHNGLLSEQVGKVRSIANGFAVNILPSLEALFFLLLAYRRLYRLSSPETKPSPLGAALPNA